MSRSTFTAVISAAAFNLLAGSVSALDPHGPTWLEGACPAKEQNKEDFNSYKFAGLWFEYVWEDHMATDMDHYVCSSFIMLDDGPSYMVYNSLMFPAEEELWAMEKNERRRKGLPEFTEEEMKESEEVDRESESFNPQDLQRDATFIAYKAFWKDKEEGGKQRAQLAFKRSLDDEISSEDAEVKSEADWSKTLQIIDTDYHSYATGLHCEERTNPETGATEHTEDYFVLTREKQPSMYMRSRARNALLKEGLTEERIDQMNKGKIFECWGKDHHY